MSDANSNLSCVYVCMYVFVQSGAPMAKVFLCCGFIPCDDKDRSYDFVAGGSNGVVGVTMYVWRVEIFMCKVLICWAASLSVSFTLYVWYCWMYCHDDFDIKSDICMCVCMYVFDWSGVSVQEGGMYGIRPGASREGTVHGGGHRWKPRCVYMYVYVCMYCGT